MSASTLPCLLLIFIFIIVIIFTTIIVVVISVVVDMLMCMTDTTYFKSLNDCSARLSLSFIANVNGHCVFISNDFNNKHVR